jgi:hypothetical protein
MNRTCGFLLGFLLFFGHSGNCQAGFIPTIDVDPSSGFTGPYGPGILGYSFTVGGSGITVDALGLESVSAIGQPLTVGIYILGQPTFLVSTSISDGSAQSSVTPAGSQWNYAAVTPTFLAPGTYGIAMIELAGGQPVVSFANITSNNPNVTFGHGVSDFNFFTPLQFVTGNFYGANGYFGPAFQTAATAVPEPSTLIWCSIGAVSLTIAGWRRRDRRMSSRT